MPVRRLKTVNRQNNMDAGEARSSDVPTRGPHPLYYPQPPDLSEGASTTLFLRCTAYQAATPQEKKAVARLERGTLFPVVSAASGWRTDFAVELVLDNRLWRDHVLEFCQLIGYALSEDDYINQDVILSSVLFGAGAVDQPGDWIHQDLKLQYFAAVSTDLLRPRLDDIEELCRAGSIRLGNWTAQNCRPDCAPKPRFDFGDVHDPLTITAVYGSEAMLLQVLEDSDVDSERFLPNSVMAAAGLVIQVGDLPRVGLIWGIKLGCRIWNLEFFRIAVRQWSRSASDRRRPGWDVVFDFLNDVLDTMVKERWANELLAMAVRENCMPVIQRLMERSRHQPGLRNELLDRSPAESRLIADAVLANHADVVEYLAGQQGIEAHLRYRNARGENVLHLASHFCNPAVFFQLVPRLLRRQLDFRSSDRV
ncbi:hypothetical protein NEMBOFW57_007166 [Staphylotrichum longicolle]|uniref:Uncharacterized protein n=1 Tax=Staphylotrichum longicolle TaxID=669026 RepID=A0AAD4EU62_9PEZI|nr:hypothetical protein NEMBOFW57_007166 [Staphylotrichum longicolle]